MHRVDRTSSSDPVQNTRHADLSNASFSRHGQVADLLCRLGGFAAPNDVAVVHDISSRLHSNLLAVLCQEYRSLDSSEGNFRIAQSAELLQAASAFFTARLGAAAAVEESLKTILPVYVRLLQEGMTLVKGQGRASPLTLSLEPLIPIAQSDPSRLKQLHFVPQMVPGDTGTVKIVTQVPTDISLDSFAGRRLLTHSHLPGSRIAYVGIGGGSDVVQCGLAAHLRQWETDVPTSCLISIRREKFPGEALSIVNSRRVAEGVYQIFPESDGGRFGSSGRFLEPAPAQDFPVYLVIDGKNGQLSARLRSAIEDADSLSRNQGGGAISETDCVVAVDTGGDGMAPAAAMNKDGSAGQSHMTTPEQDLEGLLAIQKLPVPHRLSVELAVGVDSPKDVEARLQRAGALLYDPSPAVREKLLEVCRRWDTTGSNPNRFGTTAFCFQQALANPELFAYTVLPLPLDRILSRDNTWHTQRLVHPAMRGFFYMSLDRHLEVVIG